jgi:hypothetical protein
MTGHGADGILLIHGAHIHGAHYLILIAASVPGPARCALDSWPPAVNRGPPGTVTRMGGLHHPGVTAMLTAGGNRRAVSELLTARCGQPEMRTSKGTR